MRKIFVVLVILFLGVYSLNAAVYEQLYSYSDVFTYGIGKATVLSLIHISEPTRPY